MRVRLISGMMIAASCAASPVTPIIGLSPDVAPQVGVDAGQAQVEDARPAQIVDASIALDAGQAGAIDAAAGVDAGPPPEFLGGERRVRVRLPDAWNRSQRWPLVILLHGYSASGSGQDRYFGVSSRRNELGYIALTPNGNRDQRGNRFWNATAACCDFWRTQVDDLGYLRGLIGEAIERLAVDPDRVYLIGHSNGGFMSNRMACDAAEDITAMVNVAGSGFNNETRCQPSRAVGYIQVHGTQDTVIRYPGGRLRSGGAYPGAEVLVDRWRTRNGCSTTSSVSQGVDFDRAVPGAETTRTVWSDCAGRKPVQLWTMENTRHVPGFNDDFRDAVLEALLAY